VLHGCTVGDDALIGMGAVVLNGASVGPRCLVAAGALVLEGVEIPAQSLVAGSPAKVRRALTDDEVERLRENARTYEGLMRVHAGAP
jgi:carbonic anhydrase/acetyltransferase-like protein (isoleucine patch superfamily)